MNILSYHGIGENFLYVRSMEEIMEETIYCFEHSSFKSSCIKDTHLKKKQTESQDKLKKKEKEKYLQNCCQEIKILKKCIAHMS